LTTGQFRSGFGENLQGRVSIRERRRFALKDGVIAATATVEDGGNLGPDFVELDPGGLAGDDDEDRRIGGLGGQESPFLGRSGREGAGDTLQKGHVPVPPVGVNDWRRLRREVLRGTIRQLFAEETNRACELLFFHEAQRHDLWKLFVSGIE
jgi:hypothetical protein